MTSTLWAVRGAEGAGVYHSEQDVFENAGYSRKYEVKCFRNKRKAEAWITEDDQRPTKRPRPADLTRITCDGAASRDEQTGAVGLYFGPDDPRNIGARIAPVLDWEDRPMTDRFYAEVSAVYAAIKRAPAEGKVVVETSKRLIVDYVPRMKWGRKSNWYVDDMIMSIKTLLHASNRRITLVFVPRPKSATMQQATDLAFAALDGDALQPVFPPFPVPEDVVVPYTNEHHDW